MPAPRDLLSTAAAEHAGTDAQLAAESLHDPAAFTVLYQRYAPRVYWFLRSRTASREDAADLTQQVFLRCYEALPSYEDRGLPFSAWLFRIARNAAIDHHRRQRPAVSLERLGLGALRPTMTDSAHPAGITPEDSLDLLIAGLPAGKRELLALRFGADLSIPEIAATLGKSEAAVRKQLQRLIATLKEAHGYD
jgi:RNA polymerase sigma-70 factor (ECF subfamily)